MYLQSVAYLMVRVENSFTGLTTILNWHFLIVDFPLSRAYVWPIVNWILPKSHNLNSRGLPKAAL